MNKSHMSTPTYRKERQYRLLMIFLLVVALLSPSCHSGDVATRDEENGSSSSPLSDSVEMTSDADTVETQIPEVVTGPFTTPKPVGLTLGERLKQLDARMKVAPADSLEFLMAEYDRLLDSAITGKTPAEEISIASSTSAQASEPVVHSTIESSTAPPSHEEQGPVISEATPTEEHKSDPEPTASETTTHNYTYSTPRSQMNNQSQTLVQSTYQNENEGKEFDPSQYKGARQSELKYYEKNKESSGKSASSTTSSSSSTKKKSVAGSGKKSSSGSASPTKSGNKTSGKSSTTSTSNSPQRSPEQSLDEKYTNGLTNFRAGAYQKAIEDLKSVASSSKSYRSTAKYYYGLALERTGSLSLAASQFRSLKSGSGSLSDKAWIAYARILKAQGKTAQAKKELLNFIKARPKSGQIASARELLQKL